MDSPVQDDRRQLRREGVIHVSGVDHTCSTRWALDHGFVDADCPMDATWCITDKRDVVMRQREPNPMATSLRLWQKKPLELYYAPWDWMNRDAPRRSGQLVLWTDVSTARVRAEQDRSCQGFADPDICLSVLSGAQPSSRTGIGDRVPAAALASHGGRTACRGAR